MARLPYRLNLLEHCYCAGGNGTSGVPLGMWDRLKEQGVRIAFLQRDIHINDGNAGVTLNPSRGGAAV